MAQSTTTTPTRTNEIFVDNDGKRWINNTKVVQEATSMEEETKEKRSDVFPDEETGAMVPGPPDDIVDVTSKLTISIFHSTM